MKTNVKKLSLNRETIRELGRDELSLVNGGGIIVTTTRLVSLPQSQCPCVSMGADGCTAGSC